MRKFPFDVQSEENQFSEAVGKRFNSNYLKK